MANYIILPIYFLVILYGVIKIEAAANTSPLGMKNGKINVTQISVTGITDPVFINRLRYDCCKSETGTSSGLCLSATLPQTIEIRLRKPTQVRAITIQVPADSTVGYVKSYKIFYKTKASDAARKQLSDDVWPAIMRGPTWSGKEVTQSLANAAGKFTLMETLQIVIDDQSQFKKLPCLRMEVLGCPEEECPTMWKNPTVDTVDDGRNQVKFRCIVSDGDHRSYVSHTATWIYNGTSIRPSDTSGDRIVSELKQEDLYQHLPDSNDRNNTKGGIKCSVTACKTGECALWRSQLLESKELTPTVKIDLGITTGNNLVLKEGSDGHDIKITLDGPPVLFLHKDIIDLTKGTSVLVEARFHLETRNYKCSTTPSGQTNDVLIQQKCGFEVTSVNWRNEHTVKLKAAMDGLYHETQIERKFDVKAFHLVENDKPKHLDSIAFNKQPLTVYVNNTDGWEKKIRGTTGGSKCQFRSDPHILTFDSFHYHVHLPGEFIAYRHKSLGYQINIRLVQCGGSCACGVAVKVGNAVVVIDSCTKRKGTRLINAYMMVHGDLPSGLRVYKAKGGSEHYIYLPSGTYLKVSFANWMNLYLVPSLGDRNETEGLCGFYDGLSKDDLKNRNGATFQTDSKHWWQGGYDRFGEHWRDTSKPCGKSGIFYGVPADSSTRPVKTYCNCVLGSDTYDCGEHKDAEPCLPSHISNAMLPTHRSLCEANNIGGGKGGRKKRAVAGYTPPQGEDDVYQSFVFNASHLSGPITWPTASGWTEVKAKTFCENYLLTTDAVKSCKKFLGTTLDTNIKDCTFDIQVSDTTVFARTALMNIISQCLTEARKYPATTTVLPGGIKKDILYSALCLDNCNNNGICKDADCVCNTGFYGSVCSLTKDKPPNIVYLSRDGLCNIRTRNCTMSFVFGTGYIDSSDLKCRMTPYNHITGVRDDDKRFESTATFVNFNMITCPHNNKNGTYLLAVSNNNGKAYSKEELLFRAYDSACHDKCSIDQEARKVNCTQQTTGCAIGQECFLSGEVNGENKCKICDTNINISDWSVNTAFKNCIIVPVNNIAIIAGVTSAVLVIIIILVSVLTHKYCRRRKVVGQSVENIQDDGHAPTNETTTVTASASEISIETSRPGRLNPIALRTDHFDRN